MIVVNAKPLTPKEEQDVADLLVRAKVQMLMGFPFFGILSLNLDMVQTYDVATAATDGKKFFYNPRFIQGLDEAEKNWIVVHEVMHPALKHLWRKGDRDHEKWNYACDYAIHDIMIQYADTAKQQFRDKLKMPPGCLYNIDYKDKTAEEIYDLLPKDYKQNPPCNGGSGRGDRGGRSQQSGQVPGVIDDHSKWDQQETQEHSQVKAQDWEGKMVAAAQAAEAKDAGNIPAFMKRLLGKITKPQKDWRSLLAEFVQQDVDDYSFNPPDRRYSDSEFFLPDFNDPTETVKDIVFWVDTSGSISPRELELCYSEIVGAINQFKEKLTGYVGFFDAAAYEPTAFENVQDVLKIKPQGGGGTSFHAPLEYLKDNFKDREIAGIIMLTDGCASWPPEALANGVPVLWIITNETYQPPWGLHTTLKI